MSKEKVLRNTCMASKVVTITWIVCDKRMEIGLTVAVRMTRPVMTYGNEVWVLRNIQTRLTRKKIEMLRWMMEVRRIEKIRTEEIRGLAKLNKFQKSKKNLDRPHPTHPPCKLFFLETHHWHGQNTQIIITYNLYQCIYRQNTYGILLQNISTGLELVWDDFPKKNSDWDLDPPTHFHSNLGFFEFFSLHSPYDQRQVW